MEGLYLGSKEVDYLIKYCEFCNTRTKQDINKLLLKSTTDSLTIKEIDRLKRYVFRYKMHIESNHINTKSRLNKPNRPKPTHQNNVD